jgi:hypothetical protein
MVVNHKTSGSVGVYRLDSGTALGAQDGLNVTATLEAPSATAQFNHANRLVDVLGLRFLLHGLRVHERDQGGAGTWGLVESTLSGTDPNHSGLHVLHPAGVLTLAYLAVSAGDIYAISSVDGSTWNVVNTGTNVTTAEAAGRSLVYRDSIFWWLKGADGDYVRIYDFETSVLTSVSLPSPSTSNVSQAAFIVHRNNVFVAYANSAEQLTLARWNGTAFDAISTSPVAASMAAGAGIALVSDGDDLIIVYATVGGTQRALRYTSPQTATAPASFSDISTPAMDNVPVIATSAQAWNSYVSIDPDPRIPTPYLWLNVGDYNSGTFDLFRWRYRQVTHGVPSGGTFEAGEWVRNVSTSAVARIVETDGSSLDLTDVSGAFGSGNTVIQITGSNVGTEATLTSGLTEQAMESLGAGIAATNYGVPHVSDGGFDRVRTPDTGFAKAEWGGGPVEEDDGLTRWFFRLRGPGGARDLRMFLETGESSPREEAELINGSLVVESGSPATIPTIVDGRTISNVTADGAVLYSFLHKTGSAGIQEDDGYTAVLDPVL